tara:strand:- start:527 stop:775 length:249 start_codon:yes stop_codon:yes gene_type:complete
VPPFRITGEQMLDQVNNYKERMQKVLAEAIEANNQQLLSGSTDDYAGYKFLVGIGQTLNDMSDRLETEYKKLYKDIAGGTDE